MMFKNHDENFEEGTALEFGFERPDEPEQTPSFYVKRVSDQLTTTEIYDHRKST